MTNPLLPRPIKIKFPDQYNGMEEELLHKRGLIIHNGNWYCAKLTSNGYDAMPFPPDTQVIEYPQRKQGNSLKLMTPLPVPMRLFNMSDCAYQHDVHFRALCQKRKYGKILDQYTVKQIMKEPTLQMFGHTLQATGNYADSKIYWIEANVEEIFLDFAKRFSIPETWTNC
ncbi:hypothetical protein ACPV5U_18505 [Vibrio mediterranei]